MATLNPTQMPEPTHVSTWLEGCEPGKAIREVAQRSSLPQLAGVVVLTRGLRARRCGRVPFSLRSRCPTLCSNMIGSSSEKFRIFPNRRYPETSEESLRAFSNYDWPNHWQPQPKESRPCVTITWPVTAIPTPLESELWTVWQLHTRNTFQTHPDNMARNSILFLSLR